MTSTKWINIVFKDFDDLKKKAYSVALRWKKYNLNKQLLDDYIDQFAPCTEVWQYEDVINLYGQYLNGDLSKQDAADQIKKIEVKFNDDELHAKRGFDFLIAMHKALENAEFGKTVTFTCPTCKGEAQAVKYSSPDNPAHQETFRAECPHCGSKAMN